MQEAQNLFYRIGNLAMEIPVYQKHLHDVVGIAWLVEYLSEFLYWYDATDEHFEPDVLTLESDDPEIVLAIQKLNKRIGNLFDEYIFFAYDLIRAQRGYTDLLDNYVHARSRYLSERELAEAYRSYLEDAKQKKDHERVLKDDPDKTCRDIGARRKYDEKCKDDPVWLAYNCAYKTHYARYMKKKMTAAQFEQWSRQAVEWRNAAAAGKLPQAEYERIIKE